MFRFGVVVLLALSVLAAAAHEIYKLGRRSSDAEWTLEIARRSEAYSKVIGQLNIRLQASGARLSEEIKAQPISMSKTLSAEKAKLHVITANGLDPDFARSWNAITLYGEAK